MSFYFFEGIRVRGFFGTEKKSDGGCGEEENREILKSKKDVRYKIRESALVMVSGVGQKGLRQDHQEKRGD